MRSGLPVLVVSALALAGCGGGSGGGGGNPNLRGIAVPFQAAGSTVLYQAPASGGPSLASATFTNATGITASGMAPGDTATNTVSLTTDVNGNLSTVALNFAAPGGGPALSQTFAALGQGVAPLTAFQFANLVATIAAAPLTTANAVYQGAVAGLVSSAYGAWMQSTGGGRYNVGMFAFGVETPVMPVAGTATYNGTTLGFGSNGVAPFTLAGNVMITADFGANKITAFNITNVVTQDVNDANPGPAIANFAIVGLGPIAGPHYTAAITNGPLTGSANGGFYGAGASETAGVWKAANVGNTLTVLGSYGAHR